MTKDNSLSLLKIWTIAPYFLLQCPINLQLNKPGAPVLNWAGGMGFQVEQNLNERWAKLAISMQGTLATSSTVLSVFYTGLLVFLIRFQCCFGYLRMMELRLEHCMTCAEPRFTCKSKSNACFCLSHVLVSPFYPSFLMYYSSWEMTTTDISSWVWCVLFVWVLVKKQ